MGLDSQPYLITTYAALTKLLDPQISCLSNQDYSVSVIWTQRDCRAVVQLALLVEELARGDGMI